MSAQYSQCPIVFGEVLYDCFPDGQSILGGAPFNVAWHLKGFGLSPMMVTGVGNDPLGDSVLEAMESWQMDTTAVQINKQNPTGQVTVSLENNEPSYEIVDNQAYDFIDFPDIPFARTAQTSILYHGSLAVRNATSASTLERLKNINGISSFVDINLRAPWWDVQSIQRNIQQSTWLKINEDELNVLYASIDSSPSPSSSSNQGKTLYIECCRKIIERFDLQCVVLTLGENGALIVSSGNVIEGAPVAVNEFKDTVGAGDSFTSVILMGLIKNWSLEMSLPRALQFASAVCGLRGATTTDHTFYEKFLQQWQ